jgi:hypothetical protein
MVSLLKPMVLSIGLSAGLVATANAQSVSTVPPDSNPPPSSYGAMPPAQNARTGIAGSTQSYYPRPGGGQLWKEDHSQPSAQSGAYPYTSGAAPKAN